jgi:hypothetical protein
MAYANKGSKKYLASAGNSASRDFTQSPKLAKTTK